MKLVVLVGSGHIYHMAQGGELFSALKSKLKSFSICDLEAWIVQIICRSEAALSLEKNKKLCFACIEVIDTCLCKGEEGFCRLRTSCAREYLCNSSVSHKDMQWWDSSEPHRNVGWHAESTLPAYVSFDRSGVPWIWPGRWQMATRAALGGQAVGPVGLGSGWTSPLWCDGLCCQCPAWTPAAPSCQKWGDFSHKELFLSVREALARRVDQRTWVAPDELPHTSLIS